jgi:hypothetical protein
LLNKLGPELASTDRRFYSNVAINSEFGGTDAQRAEHIYTSICAYIQAAVLQTQSGCITSSESDASLVARERTGLELIWSRKSKVLGFHADAGPSWVAVGNLLTHDQCHHGVTGSAVQSVQSDASTLPFADTTAASLFDLCCKRGSDV